MTADSSADLVKRYRIAAGQSVPVAIQRFDNGLEPASGELVDISVSGARILSDSLLQFGEKLILHLEMNSIGVSISIKCQVRWIRGGSSGYKWTVGCLFEYHLEKGLLEEYVDDGLLERRQSDRYNISLPAYIEFEGGDHENSEVDLCNIGTGGFCFQSSITGTTGSRVLMTLDDTSHGAVEGRIMWKSAVDDEYLVGCQWANRKGVFLAQQLSQATVLKPERPRSTLGDHLVGTVIIAVIAFSLGVLTTSVAFSVSEPSPSSAESWFLAE